MRHVTDLSGSSTALQQDVTLIAVVEMSQSSWLVAGIVPAVERHPMKKIEPDEATLLRLLGRWTEEAAGAGRTIARVCVAFEAGRDGFWLARWLRARGVEAHVIHPTSVAVSREHRRAKTDRLDTELLKRAFLGWLRGERDHCTMAAIPTAEEEDAKRPSREHESLVGERTRIVNRIRGTLARLGVRGFKPTLRKAAERLEALRTPDGQPLAPCLRAELLRECRRLRRVMEMVAEVEAEQEAAAAAEDGAAARLARLRGIGPAFAAVLGGEVFFRDFRNRREVGGYLGLVPSPWQSGTVRRDQGIAKSGNPRARRCAIELAWLWLRHQPGSALTRWFHARVGAAKGRMRRILPAAMARKLVCALWRYLSTGVVPEGAALKA